MRTMSVSSVFFSVIVDATKEEQVFSTEIEAVAWAERCVHTFGQPMRFTLVKITEKTCQFTINP